MNPATDPAVQTAIDLMTEKWPGSLTGEAARLGEARQAERKASEAAISAQVMAGQAEAQRIHEERREAHRRHDAAAQAERDTAHARNLERRVEAERQRQASFVTLQASVRANNEKYLRETR